MAGPFPSTAELVVKAVEAVAVGAEGGAVDAAFVAAFADISSDRAETALALGVDLDLLSHKSGKYAVASPLARFLVADRPNIAMHSMRVALEGYAPFVYFRARLANTVDSLTAARQTKALLNLVGDREQIRDTLVSLGTYAHALEDAGGGQYRSPDEEALNVLADLAAGAGDLASASSRIHAHIGEHAAAWASVPDVIRPLADALQRSSQGDAAGAVQQAGNAVEAYLVEMAGRQGVSITGAPGINAKVDRFKTQKQLPGKLQNVSKYLGHVRNAADHGPDSEVGNRSWQIRANTGTEYVFVACSFLASMADWERGAAPTL